MFRVCLRHVSQVSPSTLPIVLLASDRFRLAFQTGLALVLAYGVALTMDWSKPKWAGLAVALCGLTTVGDQAVVAHAAAQEET